RGGAARRSRKIPRLRAVRLAARSNASAAPAPAGGPTPRLTPGPAFRRRSACSHRPLSLVNYLRGSVTSNRNGRAFSAVVTHVPALGGPGVALAAVQCAPQGTRLRRPGDRPVLRHPGGGRRLRLARRRANRRPLAGRPALPRFLCPVGG